MHLDGASPEGLKTLESMMIASIGGEANGKLTEGGFCSVFQQQQQLFSNKGEYQNTDNTRQKETTANESESRLCSEDPKQSLFLSFLSTYF